MDKGTELKNNVMRRIYFVFYLKKVFSKITIKIFALVALGTAVASFVSFQNIFFNMPAIVEVGSILSFIMSAFMHTEFIVQALVFGGVIFTSMLVRDIVMQMKGTKLALQTN